jgi:rhodanese-related sulfurtransferase
MKHAKDYLSEANAAVPRISAEDGVAIHQKGTAIFIDVRDSAAVAETGTIAGALRIPRGFIEFAADDTTDYHNPALKKDSEILLVCAAGGQAALAGKTLTEMGYENVTNVGGISNWIAAGGETET